MMHLSLFATLPKIFLSILCSSGNQIPFSIITVESAFFIPRVALGFAPFSLGVALTDQVMLTSSPHVPARLTFPLSRKRHTLFPVGLRPAPFFSVRPRDLFDPAKCSLVDGRHQTAFHEETLSEVDVRRRDDR